MPHTRNARSRPEPGRGRASWLTPHVYLWMVVFPVAVSLLLAWFVELDHPSAGRPVQVSVTGDPGRPSAELFSAVAQFSEEIGVPVALSTADIAEPSKRMLFLEAPGGSGVESWLTRGYPRLLFPSATMVLPFSGIPAVSGAGKYLVYGSVTDARTLMGVADRLGYTAEIQDVTPLSMLMVKRSLLYSVVSFWVLGVTVLVASTFSRVRAYAVMRFWGNPVPTVLARELARVGRFLWAWVLIVVVVGPGALVAIGHSAGVGQILPVAASMAGVMLTSALLVHTLSLVLAFHLPDNLSAMRGKIQHLPLIPLSYVIRGPVALLLVAASISAAGSVTTVRQLRGVLDGLEPAGQAQRLAISELAAGDPDDQAAIFSGVGDWLSHADAHGQAVIAQPVLVEATPDAASEPVLLVNATYLHRHTVRRADGSPMGAPADDEVVIGVPGSRWGERERAAADVGEFLSNNVTADMRDRLRTGAVELADGQSLFTYGAQEFSAVSDAVTMRDPVVVVVPPLTLAPEFYASIAGQGGYLFTDPGRAIADVESDPAIAKYVRWIQPPAKPFLDKYRDAVGDLVTAFAAVVFLAAALLATSYGVSVVYRTEAAQRTGVRWWYGWSLARTCGWAFLWETALACMVTGVVLARLRGQVTGAQDPLLVQRQLSAVATDVLLAALVVGVAAVSLVIALRRACESTLLAERL